MGKSQRQCDSKKCNFWRKLSNRRNSLFGKRKSSTKQVTSCSSKIGLIVYPYRRILENPKCRTVTEPGFRKSRFQSVTVSKYGILYAAYILTHSGKFNFIFLVPTITSLAMFLNFSKHLRSETVPKIHR